MPNKPARQSAKYKEQQYRKRMAAQARTAGSLDPAELEGTDGTPSTRDETTTPEMNTMRFAPANSAGTSVATRPSAPAAVRPAAAAAPRTAPPRRSAAAPTLPSTVRGARGRITAQMQEMDLQHEIEFINADIRRLLILAAGSFVILIILAFVIR
jgi:hypothetical protein